MDKRKSKSITKKITVSGIVQGVGFRPFVYNIAKKHGILGTVRNIGGLVEIILQSSEEKYNDFLQDLKTNAPIGSEITGIETENINERKFDGFRIIESGNDEEISIIPPDLPVCESCERELFIGTDRRFLNPFISCMSCGARYTIIEELPYDRHNTTMRDFDMCPSCREEYTSPKNRRFHAQTISCYDCGPYLIFNNLTDANELTEKDAFEEAAKIIESGGIIAVKGIGGYHFACSPFLEDTVLKLRELKGREAKPFAIMFESVDSIREYCIVSEKEEELLKSKARPIVLLYLKNDSMAPSACQGSIYCGAFLPYTPLQVLLIKRCGPLIMTSANISNKPIIKDNQEMLSLKSPLLNGVLYNKRRIVRSVDDSVSKVMDSTPQLIRRSRGHVPYPVFCPNDKKELQIFAAGGDLKASFCLYKNGNAVMSQYFGDLEERTVLERYKASVKDLCHMLKITPDIAVCDMHPNYHSSKFAESLGIPLIYVQHHHAHIASVMAEHHLDGQVIGVAFDGTGYGTDGQIWGGEFLVCEGAEFKRAAHLRYTPILGGDASMRDAAKTAVCFLLSSNLDKYIKDERKDIIKAALKNNINTVLTSSMGRLFDAVSSLLGIRHENSYEGECAAMLEKEAVLALRKGTEPKNMAFEIKQKSDLIEIDPKPVFESLCHHRYSAGIGSLALGFHYAVADMILEVCEIIRKEQNINTVALSGGVFQNTVLMERALKILRDKHFKVYYNVSVPPNDGSIGLGQTFIGLER
ncbi:carbamoyltransferase HypF [Acetivibrio straminisolvens]|jgi:hydrogenase maturation protein HypF|nr:carbamoyltransferase HypF [Acetivibrio straminisolvens]